jgi:hypothetical protein
MAAAIDYLREYTSTTNEAKSFSVLNPVALGTHEAPYSGTWRCASVGRDKDGRIVQVLRYGWATTLAEDEARIAEPTGAPATGSYTITRYWPNIANTSLEGLVRTLKATTSYTSSSTSVLVEGKAITPGLVFAASGVRGGRAEDGSGIVYQTLTLLQSISGANSAAVATAAMLLKYRVSYEQDILNLFGLNTAEQEGMALVWTSLPDTETARQLLCVMLIDADILAKVNDGTAGIPEDEYGWSYEGRKWLPQEDGTAQFIVGFKKLTAAATWAGNKRQMGISSPNGNDISPEIAVSQLSRAQAIADYVTVDAEAAVAWAATGLGGVAVGAASKFQLGDIYSNSGTTYLCIVAHTTAGVFANDLAAGRWIAGSYVLALKRLSEGGDGLFGLSARNEPIYSGTAETDADVTEVQPEMAGQHGMVIREWYRRSLAAKNTLISTSGVAQLAFTYPTVTSPTAWANSTLYAVGAIRQDTTGGGTIIYTCIVGHTSAAAPGTFAADYALGYWRRYVCTYLHGRVRVVDHHDGAYTVVQVGVITAMDFVQRYSFSAEKVVEAEWVSVRVSAGGPFVAKVRVLYAKAFSTASAAWSWSNSGGAGNAVYDENGQLLATKGSIRETARDEEWTGYRVNYLDAFSSSSS